MHSLFSVWVNAYSTQRHLFACLEDLPAKGLPLVADINDKAFAERCTVRAVP